MENVTVFVCKRQIEASPDKMVIDGPLQGNNFRPYSCSSTGLSRV